MEGQTTTGIFLWKHDITLSNSPDICGNVAAQRAAVVLPGHLKKLYIMYESFTKSVYKDSQIIHSGHQMAREISWKKPFKVIFGETEMTVDEFWTYCCYHDRYCGSHSKQNASNSWIIKDRRHLIHIKVFPAINDQRFGINMMKMVTAWLQLLVFLQFGPSYVRLIRTPGNLLNLQRSTQTRLLTGVICFLILAGSQCLRLKTKTPTIV